MTISGKGRDITLRGGGVLRVELVNVTLGDFGDDERTLFSRITDAMYDYESKRRSEEPVAAGAVDPDAGGSNA